jgi:hypothetical protein
LPERRPRIGAYVLASDPTWLRSSVARYYHLLDVLVVSASATSTGWTGRPIAVSDCTAVIEDLDQRKIATVVRGNFQSPKNPMDADTRQRQHAIDAVNALDGDLDWVLQIDTDEVVPSTDKLLHLLELADERGADAVEWPMRVFYRRLPGGRYLQVVNADGSDHFEYPGPIAIRARARVTEARQTAERFLRPLVEGDHQSLQITRPAGPQEIRETCLTGSDAILHNSWARPRSDVWRKVSSWSHNQGLRSTRYFYFTWLPAPVLWRQMRDLHPFASGLWPRLLPYPGDVASLLDPADR